MISLNAALAAASAALEQAGSPLTIAVVDDRGDALVVLRADGARAFSVDVALGKARTAAAFGNDTAELEQLWAERPVFAHSLIVQGGWFVGRGGVPVIRDGTVVGGVGVSGNEPDQETELARAAAGRLVEG